MLTKKMNMEILGAVLAVLIGCVVACLLPLVFMSDAKADNVAADVKIVELKDNIILCNGNISGTTCTDYGAINVLDAYRRRHNFLARNELVWAYIPTTAKLAVAISAFDGGWSLRWDPEFCRTTGDGGVDCAKGYNEK